MGLVTPYKILNVFFRRKELALKQAKKDNNIHFGAGALKERMGYLARDTFDVDILSNKPKYSANKLARKLNKESNSRAFFAEPSKVTKGTYKVRHWGLDNKKGTSDDISIVDFTKPKRKGIKSTRVNGVRTVTLKEVEKDKRKSISDPMFKFRHAKDRDDLRRIKIFKERRRF